MPVKVRLYVAMGRSVESVSVNNVSVVRRDKLNDKFASAVRFLTIYFTTYYFLFTAMSVCVIDTFFRSINSSQPKILKNSFFIVILIPLFSKGR